MSAPEARPAHRPAARPRRRRRLLLGALGLWLLVALWNTQKPLAPGVHVMGRLVDTPVESIQLLTDLTARDAAGHTVREQAIHAATLELVRGARDFLVLDYFLFNAQGGPRGPLSYEDGLTRSSTDLIAALRELKQVRPELPVLVLTDPINDYYRGTPPPDLADLQSLGVEVVVTKLERLRDSNALYSATWRLVLGPWWPRRGEGWLPNLLDGAGPDLKFGALLRLPNFKANHRKVAITSDGAGALVGIVSSGNPHDASSAHSNIALRLRGEALRPLLESELAVARFSGWQDTRLRDAVIQSQLSAPRGVQSNDTRAAVATEGAIRVALLARMTEARRGDAIDVAQFYLSDRAVIEALLAAAHRGVSVRVLLDPNRDAFGFEKSGVPNRPVGNELVTEGGEDLSLRWYRTHGEQFHVKFAAVHADGRAWFTVGSANFTRRNLGDLNLEANVIVDTDATSALADRVRDWFDGLWVNAGGVEYTTEAAEWMDASRWRYWQYRVMEASGASTF
jgi:phosphatidylserine/phosphatidylglycerophosphate/cardiolipin synthase-like enzyme